jgi:translation initiation factor IF-1
VAARRLDAAPWLLVRPRTLSLRPRTTGFLTVSSRVPRTARAGDHGALIVLTTRPIRGARVAVRMRLGVVVVVRAPGRVSRRLELRRLRVRRARAGRVLDLYMANRGNVTELLPRRSVTVTLRRGRRVLARLYPAPREFLPRTIGIVSARYTGPVRGSATAFVEVSPGSGRTLRRTYHLRL